MKTTFSRTLFAFALIMLAVLLALGAVLQLLVKDYLEDQAMESLKNDCTTISEIAAV